MLFIIQRRWSQSTVARVFYLNRHVIVALNLSENMRHEEEERLESVIVRKALSVAV